VADGFRDGARLVERSPRLVPAPRRGGSLAGETPSLDEVLPRVRPGGQLEAALGVRSRLVEVAASEGQLAEARFEPYRIAKPHPRARRRVAREAVHALEHLAGESEVAAGEEDVAEVQLGVRQRAGIVAPAPSLGALLVQRNRPVEVAQLVVQPAETV